MILTDYTFGKVKIDGREFTSDLVIYEDIIVLNWRRERGHNLSIKDLEQIPFFTVDVNDIDRVIIGTGEMGMMKVPQETMNYLIEKGINFGIYPTDSAIPEFNKYRQQSVVLVGLFHLTC